MLKRYCNDEFTEDHLATLGIEFAQKKYNLRSDGSEIQVKVWDTAGQERFRTITTSFYRRANGVIIAFDLTSKTSFDSIETWVDSVAKNTDKNVVKILVGNKCDLAGERQVTEQQGRAKASQYGLPYFECSAKSGIGVDECFSELIEMSYAAKFGGTADGG